MLVVETLINRELGCDIFAAIGRAAIVLRFGANYCFFRLAKLAILVRVRRQFFVSMSVGNVESVFLIILVLLIMGCILEPIAAILVVMPILLPIGQELGFDPVHFGVFVVTALSVGFITPPVGINLFAASAVSEQPFLDIANKTIPAFLALVVTVSIIAFVPDAVLWFR